MSAQVIEKPTTINNNIYKNKVILFNDHVNSFDHVIECLIKICFKTEEDAKRIAKTVHDVGKEICYDGSIEACELVAEKLGEEKLTVSVE